MDRDRLFNIALDRVGRRGCKVMYSARAETFLFNTLSETPIQGVSPFSLWDSAVGVFNWILTFIQLSTLGLPGYIPPHSTFLGDLALKSFFYLFPIY